MYLLLIADLDVYEEFIETVYPILKVNSMYNKGQNLENRGEDFFKKSKCKYFLYWQILSIPVQLSCKKIRLRNMDVSILSSV